MPGIDMSDIFSDDELMDTFTVLRRETEVSELNGRPSTKQVTVPNVVGHVIAVAPDGAAFAPDAALVPQFISVVTQYRLRQQSSTVAADLIVWDGRQYKVVNLKSHTRYGTGFVKAVAEHVSASLTPSV